MIRPDSKPHAPEPLPSAAAPPVPILMDSSPVARSPNRVSFDTRPRIKKIDFNNGVPASHKLRQYEIKDKTLILNAGMKDELKRFAKKYCAMVVNGGKIVLKYRRKIDMDADLRALGLRAKSYMENKIIVNGIGFRETEETVGAFFSKSGTVEKVVLEKNSKGFCTGKATVTFTTNINSGREFVLGGRRLRIERIKQQKINTMRLHISHMNKGINISKLRSILKSEGFVAKNIRIDLSNGKNRGYGFVEFSTPEEAEDFVENFARVREQMGAESFVEFSKEKL